MLNIVINKWWNPQLMMVTLYKKRIITQTLPHTQAWKLRKRQEKMLKMGEGVTRVEFIGVSGNSEERNDKPTLRPPPDLLEPGPCWAPHGPALVDQVRQLFREHASCTRCSGVLSQA